jgi:ApaG protein
MASIDNTLQSAVTHGIRISVRSIFVPEQSSAKSHTFVFAYRIQIQNESNRTVQLLRRHWDITDGWTEKRVVDGDGVVGQQPLLLPGQDHTYVSGCVFKTPIGRMQGHYIMVDVNTQQEFAVAIPPFLLSVSFIQN